MSLLLDQRFHDYHFSIREKPEGLWRSQTQDIDFEKEKEALGGREIEWTEDQKFPHVATRLGFPIFSEHPFERMIGFERMWAHPNYQFQPFVQTPSMDPDPTLSFEEGETIYENKRVGEWIRMWRLIGACTLPLWPAFYSFEIFMGDGVPSLQWFSNHTIMPQIPLQLQDAGAWDLDGIKYCDDNEEHDYMNIQYAVK